MHAKSQANDDKRSLPLTQDSGEADPSQGSDKRQQRSPPLHGGAGWPSLHRVRMVVEPVLAVVRVRMQGQRDGIAMVCYGFDIRVSNATLGSCGSRYGRVHGHRPVQTPERPRVRGEVNRKLNNLKRLAGNAARGEGRVLLRKTACRGEAAVGSSGLVKASYQTAGRRARLHLQGIDIDARAGGGSIGWAVHSFGDLQPAALGRPQVIVLASCIWLAYSVTRD